ncbi:heavy-metal-associated domain-containing protein [Cellulophaga omnivescoria]|uniref:heavy-metal-associated domain-containing protein n=1 Tax=Cellulophaga omnivescoria TaxID=1888890 RepID=UPI001115A237|nr:heavy metal-associated domain-containing protein [Cellulophaga omnivescoria]WBU90377.1 heavy metal-associated domain-containing protein [Cellulophaga omnivescoria]WKB82496.1 heavy metal-associated domain-containing protein [Cellulophaga lytica]
MKLIKNISLALVAFLALLGSCKENKTEPEVVTVNNTVAKEKTKVFADNAEFSKAEFTIKGMTCQIGCAATIEKKLAKMEGVKSATVSFDKELAIVEYDTNSVTPEDLTKTVTSAASGDIYTVENMHTAE